MNIMESNKNINENDEIQIVTHSQNYSINRNLFGSKEKEKNFRTVPYVKMADKNLEQLQEIDENTINFDTQIKQKNSASSLNEEMQRFKTESLTK